VISAVPHLGQLRTDASEKPMPHFGHLLVEAIRGDYSMGRVREQLTEVTVDLGAQTSDLGP